MKGTWDAFIAKFSSSGSRIWATYYGGSGNEEGKGISIDASGNVYITGVTTSTSTLATRSAYQTQPAGGNDAFLAKFNSSGSRTWATYFGGTGSDWGHGVSTDVSGNVFITGQTWSSSGIASSGAYQTSNAGGPDAFVAKFSSSGSRTWATYYGGSGSDPANGISADANGNVYITGVTTSTSGIASSGAYQTTFAGGSSGPYDVFLAKFGSSGSLSWATYYGGSLDDYGYAICTDADNVYITGLSYSTSGIATSSAYQTTNAGGTPYAFDAFLAQFSSSGSLSWATYYGGYGQDAGWGVCTDANGNVYITGNSNSTSGIATSGVYQTSNAGGYDVILAKFEFVSPPAPSTTTVKRDDFDESIKIYPNPNNGAFNVMIPNTVNNATIEIYNSIGTLVYKLESATELNTFDLSKDANGLYLIKVISNNAVIAIQKIMKH